MVVQLNGSIAWLKMKNYQKNIRVFAIISSKLRKKNLISKPSTIKIFLKPKQNPTDEATDEILTQVSDFAWLVLGADPEILKR